MAAVKIIEVMGISDKSWQKAAEEALEEAKKTVRNITGLEVIAQTAKVKDGEIVEFHTNCKIAFRVGGK